jgi:hypothetical protein
MTLKIGLILLTRVSRLFWSWLRQPEHDRKYIRDLDWLSLLHTRFKLRQEPDHSQRFVIQAFGHAFLDGNINSDRSSFTIKLITTLP